MRIIEIAKRAKVSPATVSRVINQPHLVSPDRLKTVQAIMEHVNYVPAPIERRRGPKTRQAPPKKVGVWFAGARKNPSFNWFQEQLVQINPAANRYRLDLSAIFSDQADDLPAVLADLQLDGVIIQGMEPSPECVELLTDLPHVWFMTRRSTAWAGDYVEPDNEENGRLAAGYFHRHGHKRVTVLTTSPDYSAIAWRCEAFARHARRLGLDVTTLLGNPGEVGAWLNPQPSREEVESLAARFGAAAPRSTGLYLPTDHFSGIFFRLLRQAGLRPGQDFQAVLGNYTPVIYQNLDYQPAVIDINLPTLVHKAVDQLLWRIENPAAPGRVGVGVAPTLIDPQANLGRPLS